MDGFEVITADRTGITVKHKTEGHELIYRFAEDGAGQRVLQRRPEEAPDAPPEVLQAGAKTARAEAERLGLFNP